MTIPEHDGKLPLGSCEILQSPFPLRQETGSLIKHISVPDVLCVLFYLTLTQPWFSVGAVAPVLLMRTLGLVKLDHVPESPAAEPGLNWGHGTSLLILMLLPKRLCCSFCKANTLSLATPRRGADEDPWKEEGSSLRKFQGHQTPSPSFQLRRAPHPCISSPKD